MLDPREEELAARLRSEAQDLKDCFTRFSFQVLAFSSAGLLLVARFQAENPWVGLSAVVFGLSILLVARIGTFKYASANRILGYEMHLHRTKDVPPTLWGHRWHPFMRDIGWEEAMRAWRVVQASLFDSLYVSARFWPNRLKRRYQRTRRRFWFNPRSLFDGATVFHAGSYLRTMHLWLHSFAILCVAPLVGAFYQLTATGRCFEAVSLALLSVAYVGVVALRVSMDAARRMILEEGILSIPSCAITWQAVVIAHYSALQRSRSSNPPYRPWTQRGNLKVADGSGYEGYSYWLSHEASSLARNPLAIYDWIAR